MVDFCLDGDESGEIVGSIILAGAAMEVFKILAGTVVLVLFRPEVLVKLLEALITLDMLV